MSKEQQRGRKERFIVIPFSSTCRSASSVDVVQSNKPQAQGAAGSGEVTSAAVVGKLAKTESLSLVARLLRGFKNLSHQIFAVYDDEEEEEEEQEMVIGLPTDVKHVAHIGWDGSTSTSTSLRSWNRAAPPLPDAASTSSSSSAAATPPPPPPSQAQEPALSVRQFELAMAAQASAAGASAATAVAGAASTSGGGAAATTASARVTKPSAGSVVAKPSAGSVVTRRCPSLVDFF